MTCDRCDECRGRGDSFCEYCGSPLGRGISPNDQISENFLVLGSVIMILLSGLILFEYGVALYGSGTIFGNLAAYSADLVIIVPQLISICTISGVTLQLYYVFLLIAVALSLAFLFYRAYKPKDGEKIKNMGSLKNTALYEMTVLFAALYIIELVYFMILRSMGIDIEVPVRGDIWEQMFNLIDASVWEELVTRVLYLGVPVAIVYAITKKNELPLWRYLFGGFKMNNFVVIFMVFSAFMFGAGHLTNWGLWKFFTTFLFGLIASYLFVKYGLYATIALHFLTDYISAEAWLNGSLTGMPFTAVVIMIVAVMAVPFIFVYAKKLFVYVRGLVNGEGSD